MGRVCAGGRRRPQHAARALENHDDNMNSIHANNCEELRSRFEGREAICVEKGALRVRVSNIRPRAGFHIRADVEEIETPGLGLGLFHRPRRPGAGPMRRRLGAGYLTTFSAQSWKAGYGGWSLYFAPEILHAVVGFAARLPGNSDPDEGYRELCRLMRGLQAHEPAQLVFPDAVEHESCEFRRSDSPAIAVQVSSGWVACPCCDMRFMLSDPLRWDGEKHTTCGQRLMIDSS